MQCGVVNLDSRHAQIPARVHATRKAIALLAKYHCLFLRPYVSLEERDTTESVHNGTDIPSFCD